MNEIAADSTKSAKDLVEFFENDRCNLPFDFSLIVKACADNGNIRLKTSVHFAECPLGPVAGMQDDEGGLGESNSFFGRFHNRIYRYLAKGMCNFGDCNQPNKCSRCQSLHQVQLYSSSLPTRIGFVSLFSPPKRRKRVVKIPASR
jgi:hypothetical protein